MLPAAALVAALAAIVLAVLLVRARRSLAAEQATVTARDAALVAAADAAEVVAAARDAAIARIAEVEADRDRAARSQADAEAAARRADAQVSETAALAARLLDDGSADPAALWALERGRSERTWRHSVAAVAGEVSPFVGTREPLRVALEIEVAAVREEVGAVVDLEVSVPEPLTAGASFAVLRVAQELLADAAKKGEVTSVQVAADGADVVVAVTSLDADGEPLEPIELDLPPSRLEPEPGAVRLRQALAPEPTSTPA